MSSWYGSGGGSGGGGGAGWYGGGGGGKARPKSHKPVVKRDLSALLSNLHDLTFGFFPGMWQLGKAAYNDADVVLSDVLPGRTSTNYMLDDVGRAIGKDYSTRYGPLFHGDFKKFAEQLRTRPLDFILDAASIATLGGGGVTAAARGTLAGVKVGAVSAEAAQASKLVRLSGYVPRTPKALEDAAKVYGKNSAELARGKEAGLVRGVRTSEVRLKDGTVSGQPLLAPMRENPVLSWRDSKVHRVIDDPRAAKLPLIGTSSRAARQHRRHAVIAADALKHDMLDEPSRALRKLSKNETIAWAMLQQGLHPVEYARSLRRLFESGDFSDQERHVAEATIERLEDPEVVDLADNPSPNLRAAVAATQKLADEKMAKVLTDLGILSERQLLERRVLPQRVIAAQGRRATHHPTITVAVANARYWQRQAQKLGRKRERRAAKVDEKAAALRAKLESDGALPSGAFDQATGDVDVARLRELLKDPRYAEARRKLRAWIEAFYNEARYGTAKPSALTVRERGARQAAAKARRRMVQQRRKWNPTTDELARIVRAKGAWSREAANAARVGGRVLVSWLRSVRQQVQQVPLPVEPADVLERMLLRKGIHPENPFANPSQDLDVAADVIREWLDEATGSTPLIEIAYGYAGDTFDGQYATEAFDMFDAQELIAEARRWDPSLPRNPSNDEVASALAHRYVVDDLDADEVSKATFARALEETIMRAFAGDAPDGFVAAEQIGNIRGPADTLLADRLGIRDDLSGREPEPVDWIEGLRAVARKSGFDDDYRDAVRALANEKAVRQAKALKALQSRADQLRTTPTKREQRAAVKAAERVPMKLEGARAPGGGKYAAAELVDPATGELVRDLDAARPIDELRQLAAGASYFPHLPATAKGGPGTARVIGAVKKEPGLASNLTHRSTGAAFERGTWDMSPMMLLREAAKLVKTKLAHDLYGTAIERMSIPFDRATYTSTGGSREWVVLDTGNMRGLSKELDRTGAAVAQVEGLLNGERFQTFVRELADMQSESDRIAAAADAGQLVMVPRSYYKALTGDLREASGTVARIFDAHMDVFRALTLFARPAYYVNNVISQHLLLAVKEHGPAFIPAYIRFLKSTGREHAARELFRAAVDDPSGGVALWRDVIDTHAPELKGASVYDVEVRDGVEGLRSRWAMDDASKVKRVMGRWVLAAPEHLAKFGALLSDDLPRMFRFQRLVEPHVKAAREAGAVGDDAEIAMRLLEEDPVLRERLIAQTLDDLIDYRSMSHFERSVIRRAIPFYGWLRGITVWTAELGYNDPAALMAISLLSTVGQDANAEWAKNTPDYMGSSLLVGKEKNGRQRVINTQGLNPFATVGDVARIAEAAISGDMRRSLAGSTIAGQLNPFLRAGLQQGLNQGKDFGTRLPMGTPWSTLNADGSAAEVPGGIIGGTYLGVAGGLPQPMMLRRYLTIRSNMDKYGSPGSPSSVNDSPMSDYWWSYLGLPTRNVNVAAARNRRMRDEAVLAGEAM